MLHAYLFGTFTLTDSARPRPLPATERARALLAYLLLQRAHAERLARAVALGVFFPEMSEARARRALSQTLWHIRRACPALIESDAETIHIPRAAPVWVDVEEFRKVEVGSWKLKVPLGLEVGNAAATPTSNLQPPISNLQSLISLSATSSASGSAETAARRW
jgi:hypothetical protein